jgi:hypothetical protein
MTGKRPLTRRQTHTPTTPPPTGGQTAGTGPSAPQHPDQTPTGIRGVLRVHSLRTQQRAYHHLRSTTPFPTHTPPTEKARQVRAVLEAIDPASRTSQRSTLERHPNHPEPTTVGEPSRAGHDFWTTTQEVMAKCSLERR